MKPANATLAEAAAVYLCNVERKVGLKPRSVDYQREIVAALLKSWPQLGRTKLKTITASLRHVIGNFSSSRGYRFETRFYELSS